MVHTENDPQQWTVLVTGAGGGIGRATAQAFSAAGASVVCVDRDRDALHTTASELGESAHVIAADLSDVSAFGALLDQAEDLAGPLDSLAQLAAILRRRPVRDVTEEDWDAHFAVNAKAAFFLSRAFAERLRESGRPGSVVNTASQSWSTGGLDGAVVYAATKGALVTMTRGMARTYGPDGIRFNAVAPGFVDTEMLRDGLEAGSMDRMLAQVPLGRLATPDEVAKAIVFLASPASSYITGATIVVAGGQLMH